MAEQSDHPMKPQDWFGVGVRLFALYPLTLAVQQFLFFVNLRLELVSSRWYGTNVDVRANAFFKMGGV